MITIGYGDVHGYSPNEKLLAVFLMIIASAVFGYTMNNIQMLFIGDDNGEKEL